MRRISMVATLLALTTLSTTLVACDDATVAGSPDQNVEQPQPSEPPAEECPRADGRPCN